MGDEPIPDFGNKTPLEAAFTPNLDFLAREGICGLAEPKFSGAIPTSEEGHLSLFGYDPLLYRVRRGYFTAEGAGIELKEDDVALRGNFVTVDREMNIADRRAGRIKDPGVLIEAVEGIEIEGVEFLVKSAGEYRLGIVLRGRGLSCNISDSDPFYSKLKESVQQVAPLDETKEAEFTAKVLNKFLERSHQILENHSLNEQRKKEGLAPANYILTRGASGIPKIPTFEEKYGLKAACVAGKLLYKQIAKVLGMALIKVEDATGLKNTDLKGKVEAAMKALEEFDFVFLHIKATDSLAEDGNFQEKKDFIKKIDKSFRPLAELKDVLTVVTCDHCTCSLLKRHCKRPCPVLISGSKKGGAVVFSEKACEKGELGTIKQTELMSKILTFSKN